MNEFLTETKLRKRISQVAVTRGRSHMKTLSRESEWDQREAWQRDNKVSNSSGSDVNKDQDLSGFKPLIQKYNKIAGLFFVLFHKAHKQILTKRGVKKQGGRGAIDDTQKSEFYHW